MFRLLVCLAVMAAIPALAAAPAAAGPTQWSGEAPAPAKEGVILVREPGAWQMLWRMLGRKPPTAFDPQRQMAVGFFLGRRNHPGYTVEITYAGEHDGRFLVVYRERPPQRRAPGRLAPTCPYLVRLLPAYPGRVCVLKETCFDPQGRPVYPSSKGGTP
jgi:hypothetical protein